MHSDATAMLLLLSWALQWKTLGTAVTLDRGAYRSILVSLSENVPSHNRITLISRTESLLAQTSSVLHTALGLYVGQVTVFIPGSWDLSSPEWQEKNVGIASEVEKKLSSIDVLVTADPEPSVFGESPHSIQFGGCGVQGERINLLSDFILGDDAASTYLEKAKRLAKEWIKYRYGVFDEQGFTDDSRYPLFYRVPGADDIRMTECASQRVIYRYKDEREQNCSLQTKSFVPSKDSTCTFIPDPNANDEVTSSLMWFPSLKNVQYLCGDRDHPHNRVVPNKQNVLCRGQSVWDVLKKHKDFKDGLPKQVENLPQTVFRYVQEKKSRIVLAVEATKSTKLLENIQQNVVSHFIYSLPSGTEFGLLKSGERATTVLELQELDESLKSRNDLVLGSRFVFNAASSSQELAVEAAIEMLAPGNVQAYGTIILLASNSIKIETSLKEKLKISNLCLLVAILPLSSTENFKNLVDETQCLKVISIPNGIGIDILKHLYTIMDSAVASLNKNVVLQTVQLKSSFQFVIDQSIDNFEVWLSSSERDIGIDDDDIELKPSETFDYTKTKLTTTGNFLAFKITNSQDAKWSIKLISEATAPILLQIVASMKSSNQLNFNAWLENTKESLSTTSMVENQNPVVMYAKIFQGQNPVIDASVKAEITFSDSQETAEFQLKDNGLGDPDVMKYDGIYSRYFVHFTARGTYKVKITVDDNSQLAKVVKGKQGRKHECCGSAVQNFEAVPSGKFFRETELTFKASYGYPENGYNPSTITNLQVVNFIKPSRFLFNFSAPGGVKDTGAASSYILKIFTSLQDAFDDSCSSNQNIADDQLVQPAEYSTTQTLEINLENKPPNFSYFVCLCSKNAKSQFSNPSNVVEVFFPTQQETTTDSVPIDNSGKSHALGAFEINLIIGLAVSAIIFILVMYMAFYIFFKRRRNAKEKSTAEDKKADNNDVSNHRIENVVHDGSIRASDWQLDNCPISPVNSVPAQVLLHHHEQVQNAKKHNKTPPMFKLENLQDIALPVSPTDDKYENHVDPYSVNYAYDEADTPESTTPTELFYNNTVTVNHDVYQRPLRRTTNV